MSISEMCKFVSFNSLSLYMREREYGIRYVYGTYVLSIFVRAPIPTAFSIQTPCMKCLIHQPSVASQQFKLRSASDGMCGTIAESRFTLSSSSKGFE